MSAVALRAEDLPPVTGRPGVAQGAYGERGNLELVVPDPDEGFWVLWWNADVADARSGARPGAWSSGLHVPTGVRHAAAAITQLRRGPLFLEVVLAGESGLHRTTWSPGGGFSAPTAVLADPVVSASAVVEPPAGDALHVLASGPDGVRHLTADAARYPALDWSSYDVPVAPGSAVALAAAGDDGLLAVAAEPDGVVPLRWTAPDGWSRGDPLPGTGGCREVGVAGSLVLGLRHDGTWCVAALGGGRAPAPQLVAESFAVATSTVDGGRVELVARSGPRLQHVWTVGDGSWREAVDVRSEVWADPAVSTVHRRG